MNKMKEILTEMGQRKPQNLNERRSSGVSYFDSLFAIKAPKESKNSKDGMNLSHFSLQGEGNFLNVSVDLLNKSMKPEPENGVESAPLWENPNKQEIIEQSFGDPDMV